VVSASQANDLDGVVDTSRRLETPVVYDPLGGLASPVGKMWEQGAPHSAHGVSTLRYSITFVIWSTFSGSLQGDLMTRRRPVASKRSCSFDEHG
jgi:hypothetical protein